MTPLSSSETFSGISFYYRPGHRTIEYYQDPNLLLQACKNFYDDGVCKQECPPMQIYNPTKYKWERDPNGKYAYGATCVRECPEHLLKDNGACVRACPEKKKVSSLV